jgi:HlyD family secretion protein
MLMPRPPRGAGVAKVEETPDGSRAIYVLENGAPKKVNVRIGASDGSWTEIVGGDLAEGTPVITDSVTAK